MYLNNKNPPATALNTQIEAAINHSYNTLKDYPHGQYLFYHVLNCDYVDDAAIDTLIFLLANDMANRVHIDVAQREMERAKVMNHGKFFSDDQWIILFYIIISKQTSKQEKENQAEEQAKNQTQYGCSKKTKENSRKRLTIDPNS